LKWTWGRTTIVLHALVLQRQHLVSRAYPSLSFEARHPLLVYALFRASGVVESRLVHPARLEQGTSAADFSDSLGCSRCPPLVLDPSLTAIEAFVCGFPFSFPSIHHCGAVRQSGQHSVESLMSGRLAIYNRYKRESVEHRD
jgi:hypothetical protein